MRVLVVKTSSLGDVLHTLPALTDASRHVKGIGFHWLVEENLAEIPAWHPAVERVIVLPWRRWRTQPFRAWSRGEPRQFFKQLRLHSYDAIIDAQGLIKSALPARLACGEVWGFDRSSVREPLASLFYHHRLPVTTRVHAVVRLRELFARCLGYSIPSCPPHYGLESRFSPTHPGNHLVFIHATTWPSKHWPDDHWCQLTASLDRGMAILLPWGNEIERRRAEKIAAVAPESVKVLEKTSLARLAHILAAARAVVTVDTGPAHLAAALNVPALCLYGPTDPVLVGTICQFHDHYRGPCPKAPCRQRVCPLTKEKMAPPCLNAISPQQVKLWLLNHL